MFSNLKFAFRSLRKSPGFTAVVVLILALGIGANTAIFSLFQQLLLRPLPVPEPEKLVNLSAPGLKPGGIWSGYSGSADDVFSYRMFRDLQRVQTVFTGIAGHELFRANLGPQGQIKSGFGTFVSGNYFAVLRLQPAVGRLIAPADDVEGSAKEVAVLSYDYWQSQFAGRNIMDETVTVNGQALTIVGVAPRGFIGTVPGTRPQVFVPISLKHSVDRRISVLQGGYEARWQYWVSLFARLKPEIPLEEARAQINVPYRAILNDVEVKLGLGMTPQMMEQFRKKEIELKPGARGRSTITESMDTPFKLLLGITALVLLIACANVANLLLARGSARTSEFALRSSLGATPRQIIVQQLMEFSVLAASGCLLGVVLARWTLDVAKSVLPAQFAAGMSVTVDGVALSFAVGLTLAVVLLTALAPAVRSGKSDLLTSMKGKSVAAGGRSKGLRTALVGSQAVMAMLLLVSAGLLLQSLSNLSRVELGLNPVSLVTFRISPELNGYTPEQSRAVFERLERELITLPGVASVSAASMHILSNNAWGAAMWVQGYENASDIPETAMLNKISTDYFRTMGIALKEGRDFDQRDTYGSPEVAIVNEQFARKFNLGNEAVGKLISMSGPDQLKIRIVGVAADAKYSRLKEDTQPQFFLPYRQDNALGGLSFYVRAAAQPEQVLALASKAVSRIEPTLPVEEPKTLERHIEDNVFLDRLSGALCVAFAALATLLAAIGLYAMLAYTVSQRTREIGVCMALGAQPRTVAWPVVREALQLAAVGIVLGGVLALALGRVMRGMLFGVEPANPFVISYAALLLLAVTALAAWLPAWRASRVDPLVALRIE